MTEQSESAGSNEQPVSCSRIDSALTEAFELVTRLAEYDQKTKCRKHQACIPTGFKDIDDQIIGLWPGDLAVVSGGPSVGKTSFVINVALNAAKQGSKVLLIAPGGSITDTVVRLCASESRIKAKDVFKGRVSSGDWEAMRDTANRLATLDLHICDDVDLTPEAFRSLALKTITAADRALIVIDGAELFALPNNSKLCNWPRSLGEYSLFMKKVARKLDAAVLMTVPNRCDMIWREVEDHMDVYGTVPGGVAEAADTVLHIDRPLVSDAKNHIASNCVARVMLAKSRLSMPAKLKLAFNPRTARFMDYASDAHVSPEQDYAVEQVTAASAYDSYESMTTSIAAKAKTQAKWEDEWSFHLLFRSTVELEPGTAKRLINEDPGLCAVSSRMSDGENRLLTLVRWDFRYARCGSMVKLDRSGEVVTDDTVPDESQEWVFEIERLLSLER